MIQPEDVNKNEFMHTKELHCNKCWHINTAYLTSRDYCSDEYCDCHDEEKPRSLSSHGVPQC